MWKIVTCWAKKAMSGAVLLFKSSDLATGFRRTVECNFEMNLALHPGNMKCFFSDSIDKMVEAGITLTTLRGRRGVFSVVESFLN